MEIIRTMKRYGRTRLKVNREARDKLLDIINRYLNEEITAFQFDEEMLQLKCELDKNSEDRTLQYVIRLLWYFYDDCTDHLVHTNKAEWDLFQRLILLLKSDAHLELVLKKRRSFGQLVAAITLAICVALVRPFGIGEHLYLLVIPCGIVSLSLSASRGRKRDSWSDEYVARMPFNSLAQLRSIRRTVPDFVKKKYPKYLASRPAIRGPLSNACAQINGYLLLFILSPILLFFQMFPESDSEYSVLTAANP